MGSSALQVSSAQRYPTVPTISLHLHVSNTQRIVHHAMHHHASCSYISKHVFLQCGSNSPADYFRHHITKAGIHRATRKLLLALAGDVETNPGPPTICDSCGATIRISSLAKTIHCNQENCAARTHKLCKASGISRYSSNPSWTCRVHRGEPPLDSVEAPQAPAANAKVHCLNPECKRIIARSSSGHSWLRCISCGRCCHKKTECCRMTRDERSHKESNWTCFLCSESHDQNRHQALDESIDETAKGMKTDTRSSLRVLQWNADGLKSKSDELAARLISSDIDVAAIQETWLTKRDRTPAILGYAAIREDRKANIKRGGLIFYVKDSIPFKVSGYITRTGHEIHTIQVRLTRKKWITITNFYIPPTNSIGQIIEFAPTTIPFSPSSLICGDFNAHHPAWDAIQPEDARGGEILEWTSANNLSILNDITPTRHSRVTSNGSSPDITIAGSIWSNKFAWAVDEEEIGGSDHLPIVITVHATINHQPITSTNPRWRSNGVKWKDFRDEVEASISGSNSHGTLKQRAQAFTDAIISAAYVHVRKVKPCKRKNAHMTPKVRTLIKTRNALRKTIGSKRKEWLAACAAVSKAKHEAREEQWVEVVNSAISDIDERGMWKFIKSLNGSPSTNSPNEAMKVNGKTIISAKKKAEAFAQHYAKVSRLSFSKSERSITRQLKRITRSNKHQFEIPELTMAELKSAINRMRRKGAPGPDDISPAMLKELGPIALTELLSICNLSLRSAECPQSWRAAFIIPLLKAAKSPSDLASYRPVSLTSCIAKVIERTIAERLYHLAEQNNWFTSLQAGFRKGYSCEDQIIRLSQAIEDGFQRKPMNRAVMVLLDYSKAFDTVWRSRLLVSMADRGVPLEYIKWINGFLLNRQARVRLNGVTSSSKDLRQGVPQGCVLSPLLFLFFINNLAEKLAEEDSERANELVLSMFADDVTILARHRVREQAAANAQWAVNVIYEWSTEWKLGLNASKSEVAYFSTWNKESAHIPSVTINGVQLPFNPTPKLLGVTFDRQLTFAPHAKAVSVAATSKLGMLASVGNSSWGWDKEHLKQLYFAFMRTKLDYSGPGWQPWLADDNIKILERTQNKALRVITGQLKSSPYEALRYETRIPSYATHIKRATLKSREKAKRLPPDHPRHIALQEAIPPRNARNSWARLGKELESLLPNEAQAREPITLETTPPWLTRNSTSIFPYLEGISSKADDQAAIRAAAEAAIANWNSDLTIFTDGSAVGGCTQGGAGAVIHIHDDPPRFETLLARGAAFTSSFEEECAALDLAILWIKDNCTPSSRPLIVTDSQSLCRALVGSDPAISPLRTRLEQCNATVGIQWVPGHCGIDGNELADKAANEARQAPGPSRNTTIKGILPVIRRSISDPPCRPDYAYVAEAYSRLSKAKEKQLVTRWDAVYMARLRSGHHWDLRTYMHRVTKDSVAATVDPACPRCRQEEDDTPHLFKCVGTLALRQEIFGTVDVPLCALTDHPKQALTLARRSLRGAGKRPGNSQDNAPPDPASH